MKKIRIILVSIVLILCSSFLFACTPAMERFSHLISELRDNVFVAENEKFSVSIITGAREEPFILNGFATGTKPFTLITIVPKNGGTDFYYSVVINGDTFEGKFVPHPFDVSLSAEVDVLSNDSVIQLTVIQGENREELTANSVLTEQMINSTKAIDIAYNRLKGSLEDFKQGGELQCEIFVRLIKNPIDNQGGYFWYVAFVGTNQTIFAVVIEPTTMTILAVRE